MPGGAAVLVDDDRKVVARLPELLQERREILRLGDDVRRADDLVELHVGEPAVVDGGEEVAHVEDADRRRRATRGRPGSACTASRAPSRAPAPAASRPTPRQPRAAAPSRPPRPCRRRRRPCRSSAALRARSRPPGWSARAACAAPPRRADRARRPATRARARAARPSVALRSAQTNGANTVKNARTGADTQSAVPSACPSATPFGTSSPITTCANVRIRYASSTAMNRRDPVVEGMRERLLAEGADAERGERDAELHRCDELRWVGRDAQHRTRAPVALVVQLDDPRAARRDERVLRRHEEGVDEDQRPDAEQLECEGHAPNLGA